ncbi:MFS family permease [Dietzia sp. 2505]|uniref:MFS transporter n=1 Tax=Dietzia sp. 2505 TaxID=3156457 RepID=UPI00339973B9
MSTTLSTLPDDTARIRRGGRLGLFAVLIGTFVGTLSNNLLNVPLHSILLEFEAPLSSGIFVIVGFMLTFAVSMPLFGWFGERYGLRLVYCLALIGTAICSIGAALAPNLPALVAWRVFAGLAAASFAPVIMALISWMFGAHHRAVAISAWATVNGLGQAIGPSAGGLVDGWLTWRWALGSLAPMCLIGLVATIAFVPRHRGSPLKLDLPGATTFTLGAGASILSVLMLANSSVPWPVHVALVGAGVVLIGVSVWWSRRTDHPFVPVHLMGEPRYVLNSVAGFSQMFTIGSILVLIPLYLTSMRGMSTAQAGLVLLALPVTMAVVASSIPRAIRKWGLTRTLVSGLVLLTVSVALLAVVLAFGPANSWLTVSVLVINGIGIAMVQTPASTGATQTLAGQSGSGLGIFNLVRFSGSAMGAGSIAVLSRFGDLGATTLFGSLVVLVAAILVALILYRPLRDQRRHGSF